MNLRSMAWLALLALLRPACGRRAEAMPNRSAPTAEAPPAPRTYTVQPGDGWFKIASDNQVTMPALLAANDATVATAIHPGQTLHLPSTDSANALTAVPSVTSVARPPPPPPVFAGEGASFEGAGGGTVSATAPCRAPRAAGPVLTTAGSRAATERWRR